MKRLIFICLPLLLFAQSLDSLRVDIINPDGGAVQGIKRGFSKLIINTGISDLQFDPVFTMANSEHFKITKTASGFEIIVNIRKLEKKPGFYSELKFAILHPKFVTFNLSMSANPGRSYEISVNPMTSTLLDPALLQKFSAIKTQIDNGFYDNAKQALQAIDRKFQENYTLKALGLYLSYKEGKSNQVTLLESMKKILALNIDFNYKQEIVKASEDLEIILYSDLRNLIKNQRYEEASKLASAYLGFAQKSYNYFDRISDLYRQAKEELSIKVEGINKTVRISVPIKPAGMQLIIDGVEQDDLKRDEGPNGVEYVSFNYNYKIFSKTKLQQIKWSIVDPNGNYQPLTFEDFEDKLIEWVVSYNTPAEKVITTLIELKAADQSSWYWYAAGAGAVIAAVILSSGSDETAPPGPAIEIADPKSPSGRLKLSTHQQLQFGFRLSF